MKYFRLITLISAAILLFPLHSQGQVKVSGDVSGVKTDSIAYDLLDNTVMRAYYRLDFVKDTANIEKVTHSQTILQIGSKYMKFWSLYALGYDSIMNAMIRDGKSAMEVMMKVLALPKSKFRYEIVRGYPEKNSCTFQYKIGNEILEYRDDDTHLTWTLHPEKSGIIEGYTCYMATCSYRGRDYVAWYAPDIAMPHGPYVFGGLPGLILKLADTRGHFVFEINGLIQMEGYDPIYLKSKNRQILPRADVRKSIKNLHDDARLELRMMSDVFEYKESQFPGPAVSTPYNPIELE